MSCLIFFWPLCAPKWIIVLGIIILKFDSQIALLFLIITTFLIIYLSNDIFIITYKCIYFTFLWNIKKNMNLKLMLIPILKDHSFFLSYKKDTFTLQTHCYFALVSKMS